LIFFISSILPNLFLDNILKIFKNFIEKCVNLSASAAMVWLVSDGGTSVIFAEQQNPHHNQRHYSQQPQPTHHQNGHHGQRRVQIVTPSSSTSTSCGGCCHRQGANPELAKCREEAGTTDDGIAKLRVFSKFGSCQV
jgi:hypothetical protein